MGEFKHDLIVHLKDTFSIIAEVDPDRYCHMDMLNDICKCAIGDEQEGYMILVWYDTLGTNERLEITNDVDMVTMFNLHAGVVLIHLYVEFVSTNCKNLTPNVVCEISGSMVRVNDDVVYREEDDDTDYVQDSSDDSSLSDDSDKLGSGVYSDEDNDEAGNGFDGNWSNYDSEDCDRELNDSDVENNHVEKGLYGKQYVPNENEKVSLEKGMLFRDVYEFRATLRDYVIGEGVEIVRLKNEKSRVRAICADLSCNWYVFASPTADGITFQIKVYNSDHICVRSSKNTNATSTWIAQKLAKSLKADPNMSYESMGEALMEKYGVEVDRSRLYRARKRGKGEDVGSHSNSYKKLAKYAQLVRQTNPGSYVKMQLDRLDITQNPTFKRFFVCFAVAIFLKFIG